MSVLRTDVISWAQIRLSAQTNKRGPVHPVVGRCWLWIGRTKNRGGYGRLRHRGRLVSAHRMTWILSNGSIPVGMNVCHRCDNRLCVRPDHLFLGTQKQNLDDMRKKGRSRGIFKT